MSRIDVIDDDPDLRQSLEEILGSAGYDVFTYASADAWLQSVRESTPEIVLIDDRMPGTRGLNAIPEARRRWPAARIIMVTAFASVDSAVGAMKAGADDYLAKPFRKEALLELVAANVREQHLLELARERGLHETLRAVANPIRAAILDALARTPAMRFMEITRAIGVEDHTKVNFHLKTLRARNLIELDDDRGYRVTETGQQLLGTLAKLAGPAESQNP